MTTAEQADAVLSAPAPAAFQTTPATALTCPLLTRASPT